MKNLTAKGIKNYLDSNYGTCRHNPTAMAQAARYVAKRINCTPKEVFHLVVENEPISGFYTHSYGFHTALGRDIINAFEEQYYNYSRS
jgi:hypothetical protein